MESKSIHIGVNVILKKNDKVLLGKRINIAGHGMWGVPGGHLEPGESITDGAKRELLEETGVVANEIKLVNIINQPTQPDGDRHYIQFNFLVENFDGEVTNTEPDVCAGWEWFDVNVLPNDICWPHKDFIAHYLNGQLLAD